MDDVIAMPARTKGRSGTIGLAAALPTIIGCMGAITGPPGAGLDEQTAGTGGAGTADPVAPAADAPLRRLTRTEYANTVRDLFFLTDTAFVASVLPAEK